MLHFPSRVKATDLMKHAIIAANNLDTSFAQHAAKFGEYLHLFQDSFSHSFPMLPGKGYNLDSKATYDNITEKYLAYHLKKFNVQSIFPNISFGKGAVIRHVILGHYPDDLDRYTPL